MDLGLYFPLIVMLLIATAFAAAGLAVTMQMGPRRFNRVKYDSYECGIQPTPQPVGGGRFQVKYYITAMLFIVFDIEIVFLYPWAVAFDELGPWALIAMVLFIDAVLVAYLYVIQRGGLQWEE
ncbi:NADH-quinone oxidoreductase subunit A [Propioniferax innocua]|uniref:NADH-quinone oxidoreductase subunit A n=1 Tax=Propioniferax innocua TaxID=1753 RepID=A0A542ZD72_9ACTN|nr:NADH-quinone oxidoreductase subunit A [Propioniferax innocua]TQL58251.1 NADH dehydrogenase subunit A [Propioniferax innocua]